MALKSKAKQKAKLQRASPVAMADRWTQAKRAAFLTALVETASVMGAARIAGVPETSPYRLRTVDPAFRAAWDSALDEAYEKLELLLLRRATYGEAVDGEDAPTISTSFALALLKAHQTRARRGAPNLPGAVRGGGVRDRLEAKLAEMNRRLDASA